MIPIELDQEIREGVFKTLPQIMDIQNEELRNKTADAWTYALQINGFKQIEEMPGSGMPEASALGDQSMHIRAVGYNTLSLYENLSRAYEMDLGLDKDILIASALLHDVGKPYEYSPRTESAGEKTIRQQEPPMCGTRLMELTSQSHVNCRKKWCMCVRTIPLKVVL